MNDCNTEIILCKLVEKTVKLLSKHGNCLLCQQLRERRFECSGKTFFKGLLDTGEVLVQIYQYLSKYAHFFLD